MAGRSAGVFMGIAGVILGIGGTLGWQAWNAKRDRDSAEALQQRVRAHLADPESARFQNLRFFSHSKAVCGQVNAKNRMGGYVGFTSFVLLPNETIHFRPEEPSSSLSTQAQIDGLQKMIAFNEMYERDCFAPRAASGPVPSASQ